jgi:small Trp-rich protein
MYAVIVGVLLVAAKLAELGPFGGLSWWIVLAPFAVAAVWWQFSDSTGITKRREIERLEERKQDRRDKAMAALGLDHRRDRRARQARETAERRNEMTAGRHEARGDGSSSSRDPRG